MIFVNLKQGGLSYCVSLVKQDRSTICFNFAIVSPLYSSTVLLFELAQIIKKETHDVDNKILNQFFPCRLNPSMEFNYDGSSIHPYEVMFVPMNTIAIENGWSYAKLAALYETWIRLQVFSSFSHSMLILNSILVLSLFLAFAGP